MTVCGFGLRVCVLAAAAVAAAGQGIDASCNASCLPCQGLGGIVPYGKTTADIVVPGCKALPPPDPATRVPPLYPKTYTALVSGSYSSRALARPFDHNYYHLECTYWYSYEANSLKFINRQHIKDKINVVEGIHRNHTLISVDVGKVFGHDLCYCMDYKIAGEEVGPVAYDAFAHNATYVGRELLDIEYLNKTVAVDHYMKSFYHFWFDFTNNVPIRSVNTQNGGFILSVYHNWTHTIPDGVFDVPKACGEWWQKPWDGCPKNASALEDAPSTTSTLDFTLPLLSPVPQSPAPVPDMGAGSRGMDQALVPEQLSR